jgi:copper chaperone CopZ
MTAILDVRIPARATELCPLRREVATALHDRAVADRDADAFVSVVNELVTAALGTTPGPLEVRVQLERGTARASVADISSAERLRVAPDADHDIGFALLDHLAGSWGISYDRGHAYLWAESPVVRTGTVRSAM